ncbi:MAG: hypothetical protein OEY59_10875 [Deltaproteobacteria bacterium]|nr:hypothetical protein [Deltaproteobacteria bacterium]
MSQLSSIKDATKAKNKPTIRDAVIVQENTSIEIQSSAKYFTETGLHIPENTTDFQWQEIGKGLSKMDKAIQWAIGDWFLFGEKKFGEIFELAEDITGYKKGTLINFKAIASKFSPSRRRDELSWNHFQAIQALPEKKQDQIIEAAIKENLSVAKLRNMIRGTDQREEKNLADQIRALLKNIPARDAKTALNDVLKDYEK